ncbi:MAG: hypothetical protein U0228_10605 [Myxococcaceae bacterium]
MWLVEQGTCTRFIDATPFLLAEGSDGARPVRELRDDLRALRAWGADLDEVDPWLERVPLSLFWDPLAEALPPLKGPLLEAGPPRPWTTRPGAPQALQLLERLTLASTDLLTRTVLRAPQVPTPSNAPARS